MGVADARITDLEEEKAQLEEAKAAAEAASKEAFALREKQTERIKRTKAGGPGGESATIFFLFGLTPYSSIHSFEVFRPCPLNQQSEMSNKTSNCFLALMKTNCPHLMHSKQN